ncbi:MAG TPA: hypothetical protein PLZ42_01830 [Methanothrix sp.]|nr:hypothetical protein [Methanothrix sp.]
MEVEEKPKKRYVLNKKEKMKRWSRRKDPGSEVLGRLAPNGESS